MVVLNTHSTNLPTKTTILEVSFCESEMKKNRWRSYIRDSCGRNNEFSILLDSTNLIDQLTLTTTTEWVTIVQPTVGLGCVFAIHLFSVQQFPAHSLVWAVFVGSFITRSLRILAHSLGDRTRSINEHRLNVNDEELNEWATPTSKSPTNSYYLWFSTDFSICKKELFH